MPLPTHVILKELRKLHLRRFQEPVDEELRGWNWDKPPIRPRAYLGLSVIDAAPYCPTRRDVWLRKAVKVPPELNEQLKVGLTIHEIIHATLKCLRKYVLTTQHPWTTYEDVLEEVMKAVNIPEGMNGWGTQLIKYMIIQTLAEASWNVVGEGATPWLPWISEVRVDGSSLGLSKNLRIDALTGSNILVDFKMGKPCENHKLMVTAYAMALEANLEVPIDYGIIIYVNGVNDSLNIKSEPIYVTSELRKDFIDSRDEVVDMLLSDREPPKAQACIPSCPYRNQC
ncbi:MAG: type I-A CRISPR-associated protein Cas4/Csa1 [Sulfolobales archaeon]|nr:type I-A CRISPR-associated protein Cas4/Csa1 [Sulfolobales archaeon]MCX8186876.1 type I-A CRISPR-associated protein Cas4/Csa1 [Sulfolobales archaeon]MDW7970162.1 type I-A CRISPR-associated protein Cas4/Csa1 [Sulfolobales archaeon]